MILVSAGVLVSRWWSKQFSNMRSRSSGEFHNPVIARTRVSVPLNSRPVSRCGKGGTTPPVLESGRRRSSSERLFIDSHWRASVCIRTIYTVLIRVISTAGFISLRMFIRGMCLISHIYEHICIICILNVLKAATWAYSLGQPMNQEPFNL